MVLIQRRITDYLIANAWEVCIAFFAALQALFYLAFPHLLTTVPIARAYPDPFDTLLTLASFAACCGILLGTLRRLPKLRAAALVSLAGATLIRVIATFSVDGPWLGIYSLPTTLLVVCPSLIRVYGIVTDGDYPPPMMALTPPPVLEPRER